MAATQGESQLLMIARLYTGCHRRQHLGQKKPFPDPQLSFSMFLRHDARLGPEDLNLDDAVHENFSMHN